jgi:hypothetical protein
VVRIPAANRIKRKLNSMALVRERTIPVTKITMVSRCVVVHVFIPDRLVTQASIVFVIYSSYKEDNPNRFMFVFWRLFIVFELFLYSKVFQKLDLFSF